MPTSEPIPPWKTENRRLVRCSSVEGAAHGLGMTHSRGQSPRVCKCLEGDVIKTSSGRRNQVNELGLSYYQ